MSIKVIVPNKGYSEIFMGVQFENGVGVFEDEKLGHDIAHALGYEVEGLAHKVEEKSEPMKKVPARKKAVKKVAE